MTKIELDAVVNRFLLLTLKQYLSEVAELAKEKMSTELLSVAVINGDVRHRYDEAGEVDEFLATDQLVDRWSSVFPDSTLPENYSDRTVLELSGRRSRYFYRGWKSAGKLKRRRAPRV